MNKNNIVNEINFGSTGYNDGTDWFYMVPHIIGGLEGMKIGYHQQGDIMSTEEFILKNPNISPKLLYNHRNMISYEQSGDIDTFALEKCVNCIDTHFTNFNTEKPNLYMRCLYTNTPDNNFIIGPHPEDNNFIIATGFCGEGFKHAPLVGKYINYLIFKKNYIKLFDDMDIMFNPKRFFL